MDLVTNSLNNVLAELQEWCDKNLMVPHQEKCKAMIMQRKPTFTGPIQALRLGNNIINWTTSERLHGVQPSSQSSSAISDVTSPVKLVGKVRLANNGKSKMAAPECDFSQDS